MTDANQGGVEKLSVCEPHYDYGCKPPHTLGCEDLAPECVGLIGPMAIFYVKGWTRSICNMTIVACMYEEEEFRNQWPSEFQKPPELIDVPNQLTAE